MFDDNIEERYSLAIERISEINKDDELSDYGAGSYADYFKNVSNTLNEILVGHDVVILYRDESKDANNYVLISGEIKNIIKEV